MKMNFPEVLQPPRDLKELAEIRAQQASTGGFYHDAADEQMLAELDFAADELKFFDQTYLFETNAGLVIPKSWDDNEGVDHRRLDGLYFEATPTCYSRVSIGRIIGHGTVRALCVAFDEASLLSHCDRLDGQEMLHVPVLAINDIARSN